MVTTVSKYLSALPGLNLGLTNGASPHSSNGVPPEPSRLVQLTQAQIERYVTSSLPPLDQRARALCFADHPALSTRLLRNIVGDHHVAYNYLGVETIVLHTSLALAHYGLQVGMERFLEDYRTTKESEIRLKPSTSFIDWGRRHYALWIQEYARANGWNVFFEGIEKIPRDQPVVYAVFPHSSIFPDFFLPYVDENVGYVADATNFRNNPGSRAAGFSLYGDLIGQPLVDRKDPEKRKILSEQILEAAVRYHLHAAWFPHGTRVPRAWHEDGRQARAGFYSGNPDKGNYRVFVQSGYAANAVQLATKLNKPVKLVVVTIRGAEFAMSKESSKAPFFQKNLAGATINYQIVDVLDVPVATSHREARQMPSDLAQRTRDIAEEALGIRDDLAIFIGESGEQIGYRDARQDFEDKIANPKSGTDYLIVADRIRSIPPRFSERAEAKRQLFDLLRWQGEFPKESMNELLGFVTQSMEKYQHATFG